MYNAVVQMSKTIAAPSQTYFDPRAPVLRPTLAPIARRLVPVPTPMTLLNPLCRISNIQDTRSTTPTQSSVFQTRREKWLDVFSVDDMLCGDWDWISCD
jgi:hypothetical protein